MLSARELHNMIPGGERDCDTLLALFLCEQHLRSCVNQALPRMIDLVRGGYVYCAARAIGRARWRSNRQRRAMA